VSNEEQDFPFIESKVDYDALTFEQQAVVDSWETDGLFERAADLMHEIAEKKNVDAGGVNHPQ